MAYEQRPKDKSTAKDGVKRFRLERMADTDLANHQRQQFMDGGFEIVEEGGLTFAQMPIGDWNARQKGDADRARQQVIGTQTLTQDDRNEGMNLSTVEHMTPVTADELMASMTD